MKNICPFNKIKIVPTYLKYTTNFHYLIREISYR